MANSVVVPTFVTEGNGRSDSYFQWEVGIARDKQVTPISPQVEPTGSIMQLEGQDEILSESAIRLVESSTRKQTKVKYNCIQKKWKNHCMKKGYPDFLATTNSYVNFLAEEFDTRNLKYSYIRSYSSALQTYLSQVDFAVVKRLLKGMHNERPPRPKYCVIWDVNVVLNFVSAMRTDTLMLMTQKLATLLMLLSGNRVNMLSEMKIANGGMVLSEDLGECTFKFSTVLKHTTENSPGEKMTFRAYDDPSLCPVTNILQYLQYRNTLSDEDSLFIITRKPHNTPRPDIIAGWIKEVLCAAGVDTGEYQAHSCRAASTSTAALAGVSLSTILDSASWKNVKTFKKFYHKEIVEGGYNLEKENFGEELLRHFPG